MTATAAPPRFPYREHRTIEQVDREQQAARIAAQYPRYVRGVVLPPTERIR